MNFTKDELVNMIFVLGECEKNCMLASRIYNAKYPERRPIREESFQRVLERFIDTGSVKYKKKKIENRNAVNDENALQVLLHLQENPHLSCRQIADQYIDISKSSVNRILKVNKFHPFHIELHQDLYGDDFQNRVTFCNILNEKINQNQNFLENILFSDEAIFKSNAVVNRHNMHYYAVENPLWLRQINYQNRWSLHVWGGIIGNQIIGPFIFDGPITGDPYYNFLTNELPGLLQNVQQDLRENMWYQHDGAPAHFALIVQEYLNNWKTDKWIGRGGSITWPPRSPDLTPIDFFLWGHVKQEVYQTPPTTPDNMKDRIRQCFARISHATLIKVRESIIRRLQLCIEQNGQIFEHLMH